MNVFPSKIACSIALLTLGSSCYAQHSYAHESNGLQGKVMTLSLGSSWSHGSSVTEQLAEEVINTYQADKTNRAFVAGELFAGVENTLSPSWIGQLGVALALAGNASLKGDIWENADPDFNNYTYKYSVARTYVGLKGKLLKETATYGLMPYLSASLGLSFNYAHGYSSTPKIFEEVANAPFKTNVSAAFSYAVGAGVQKQINSNWSAGVGYEFSDWGRNSLGAAPGQIPANSLVLNHLYNNAVLFNFTYHA
jgi:opacity protein-like surface antigen